MESANLHHHQHQLQDQFVGSSSLDTTPSCYGEACSHSWPPNTTTLNTASNFNLSADGAIICSRDPRQRSNMLMSSVSGNSMVQDLGSNWMNVAGTFNTNTVYENDSQLARIKEEFSDSYSKFTDMTISTSPSSKEDFNSHPATTYVKNEERNSINDFSEKLLLRSTWSPGLQLPAEAFYSHAQSCSSNSASASAVTPSRGIFSQIFPTMNISNLNQPSSLISGSLEMNLQSLDPLASTRFSGDSGHIPQDHLGLLRDSLPHVLDLRQKLNYRQSHSSDKISPFIDGVSEAKRPGIFLEPKAPQAAQKKSRLESRVACQPFKIRKEKLGDRIAALQQLVAPFGKTDTASVLMEAIGYIKFLQNQVETLSVPYMKSTRHKTNRTLQGGTVVVQDGSEELKRDLKSRGLCLVPLSCLSYVTDGGGAVWPPPI